MKETLCIGGPKHGHFIKTNLPRFECTCGGPSIYADERPTGPWPSYTYVLQRIWANGEWWAVFICE